MVNWQKLKDIMIRCWKENVKIQSTSSDPLNPVVVRESVPVLWFGDIDSYAESKKRVVTVGINPSKQEFVPTRRFPISMSPTPPSFWDYKSAMSQYFSYNPYLRWFSPNECALNACDSTYGGKVKHYEGVESPITNTGLHIDIVAPLATKPWGRLTPLEQSDLTKRFSGVFDELVEALDPDVLIFPIKLSTYFKTFSGTLVSSKTVHLESHTYTVNKYKGRIGSKERVVIEGWNGTTPFPFVSKSVIYSAIYEI